MTQPTVIVYVMGGVVQDIASNIPVRVILCDYDVEAFCENEPDYKEIDSEPAMVCVIHHLNNPLIDEYPYENTYNEVLEAVDNG